MAATYMYMHVLSSSKSWLPRSCGTVLQRHPKRMPCAARAMRASAVRNCRLWRAKEFRAGKAAVAGGDGGKTLGVALGEALDNVDGAVLAAGAADGDREIAAVVRFVFGDA